MALDVSWVEPNPMKPRTMKPGTVEVTRTSRGAVAVITLRHPSVRNALTMRMWKDLARIVKELDADPMVRAIVIGGYGMDFSTGAHIGDLPDDPQQFHRIHLATEAAIADSLTPVIAAISGDCIGGGLEIAVAADLRIADVTSRFGITASRLGLVYPQAPTRRLVDLVGVQLGRRMLMCGELFDVSWAVRCGLVGELVPAGMSVTRALEIADLLTRRSPVSIEAVQSITRGQQADDTHEGIHYREGRAAFLEHRDPQFPLSGTFR